MSWKRDESGRGRSCDLPDQRDLGGREIKKKKERKREGTQILVDTPATPHEKVDLRAQGHQGVKYCTSVCRILISVSNSLHQCVAYYIRKSKTVHQCVTAQLVYSVHRKTTSARQQRWNRQTNRAANFTAAR